MFNKVLIANRGAIATRIIRTLKRLGVTAVAVYAEADIDSLHVSQADEAYSLGEGRATDTYLNQDRILAIAQSCGAEAIHPGYGFLSENPDFVSRCEAAGIAFIGPTPEQMRAFGLKHTARELARDNSIPMLPGTELLESVDDALMSAERIGYPVMLKSTAGGGGIGMQLCNNQGELHKAFESVRRLSANNFSNNGVFLEKFIEQARHIEVQIFGDGSGHALALGERDCSSQRRNQKVIEECPAPNLPHGIRQAMHETAVRLVTAVAYRNAGTVEFVYDPREEEFYFLEVNTRLQVEHGVTEQVYGVDLVEWMLALAAGDMPSLPPAPVAHGHAIQVRIYAEDPHKGFQPCAGLLSEVRFPQQVGLRIDHWIETGIEVSPLFDPMLAKVIVSATNRGQARTQLDSVLSQTHIYGIETNIDYVRAVLDSAEFIEGRVYTRFLNDFTYQARTIDVLSAGTLTTIQDYPGRTGYWHVGVPPSGPFDSYAFRLGNRLLENNEDCAGLELTLNGPTLRFNCATHIVLTGAAMQASLDQVPVPFYQIIAVEAGQTLRLGRVSAAGARTYILVKGGIDCPRYLGARATFTLGQFGGHAGRALHAGDVLHLGTDTSTKVKPGTCIPAELQGEITQDWTLRVIYGPHGAPDFFTRHDIQTFFAASWEVHYNSSRTGIRLIGPKPQWARSDGGEAGMHPSNIHDNAYAIGTIDFTGDMPVILGPDGPSLGGFVCPATVISADLWKLGQLKAGNTVRFEAVSIDDAVQLERAQQQQLAELRLVMHHYLSIKPFSAVLKVITEGEHGVQVVYRPSGDKYLLVEYGPQVLDISLRFRVHALMLHLQKQTVPGILELTPGIRSLQVHYDSLNLSLDDLLALLEQAEYELQDMEQLELPVRIVHLPLSWDDEACQTAINKYMQSVRKDAPWCPSNIEFIRRINGLDNVTDVKRIVFEASYLVMGLGDVYLGAPVATPLDPRHRLVTTKYNPARTWTAENSVGIGGSYLCVYGMEGPGGYQFVGRTLQMWNRYHRTAEFSQPWLLRFFDQIRFYEVSGEELQRIRRDFPKGRYPLQIETSSFRLKDYLDFLHQEHDGIAESTTHRQTAFAEELQRWVSSGQFHFDSSREIATESAEEEELPHNCMAIESPVAGNVWRVLVNQGDTVRSGQPLVIMESMKMEIEVTAQHDGIVYAITRQEGNQVNAGQPLIILQENN